MHSAGTANSTSRCRSAAVLHSAGAEVSPQASEVHSTPNEVPGEPESDDDDGESDDGLDGSSKIRPPTTPPMGAV